MDQEPNFDDTSDSSFEIISQSSFHTSDDESHVDGSDSVASLDNVPTDDASSSVEDVQGTSEEDESLTTPIQTRADIKIEEQLASPSLASSSIETFPSAATIEPIDNYVKFMESANSTPGLEVEVTHVVRNGRSSPVDPSQTLTIKQTMSSRCLKLDRPFRILYCGDATIKDDIIEKMAQAIAASPTEVASGRSNSSRLNIILMSSFGKEHPSPDVMLIPSTGLEVAVDDCTGFRRAGRLSSDANELFFTDVPSFTEEKQLEDEDLEAEQELLVKFRRPDLAIVTHGNVAIGSLTRRRSGDIARLGVPVIDICENTVSHLNPATTPQFAPSNSQAIHQCLEIRSYNDVDYKTVVKLIPIDLSCFLGIDSFQLNRNIACLTGLHDGESQPSRQRFAQLLMPVLSFFTSLVIELWHHLQAAVCQWRTLHSEVRKFVTARFDLIRPAVLSWESIRYLLIPLVIMGTHLYVVANSSAELSEHAAFQNRSSSIWAPSSQTKSPSALESYTQITTRPTPLVAVTHSQRAVFTVTETSTVTRFEAIPTYRSLPQGASSETPSFPLLTSQEGKLLLTLPKKLPRLWQPSEGFVEVFEDQKRVNASLTKISNRTYELHRQVINGCKPFVVNVQSIHDPKAHRTYSLPPVKDCGFYSIAKAATNKARVVVDQSTSHIGSRVKHLAGWSSMLLRNSSDRVHELVKQMSTRARTNKTEKGSLESITSLATGQRSLIANSTNRFQKMVIRMRQSAATYTNDSVLSWVLPKVKSQHETTMRIANSITKDLKIGKDAFQERLRNLRSGFKALSTEVRHKISRTPQALMPAKPLKTARSRAFAVIENLRKKETELRQGLRRSRWQTANHVRKSSEATMSGLEDKRRGLHNSPKVSDSDIQHAGRRSYLWNPFARRA